MPFETAVRLEFERFHGFVEQYSANLSLGGMFINSESLPPLGSEVAVEFRLGDGYELIRGRGRVVWVRPEGDEPSGFGLRFLELTPGSRELIFRLVERRVREGEPVFDVDEKPKVPVGTTGDDGSPLASPPWDLPPPRSDEEAPSSAAGGGGERGTSPRFGSAAREAEGEPDDPGPPDRAAAEIDPEVSFAGIAEEEGDGPGLAPTPVAAAGSFDRPDVTVAAPSDEPRPPDLLPAIDEVSSTAARPAGPETAGRDEQAPENPENEAPGSAGWPWTEGEESSGASAPQGDATASDTAWPWASPLAEAATGEVVEGDDRNGDEAIAGLEPASVVEEPGSARRSQGGRRWLAVAAVGLAVVALGLFLLLRASAGPQHPGETSAGDEDAVAIGATPAATAERSAVDDRVAVAPATDMPPTTADSPPPAGVPGESAADTSGAGPGSIERIAWERRAGGVDFEISGAGAIPPTGFDHFRVGGAQPRFVVRIAGVERPYARGAIDVDGPLVTRVRTGFHPAAGAAASGSLHVVFDLTPPGSAVPTVETVAGRLRVRFEAP